MGKKGITRKQPKRLYNIWVEIRARCERPTKDSYCRYGGRGIKVCSEWHDWNIFRNWALSNGYEDNLTIDRVDVNGDYTPQNCRWISKGDQARNRRTNRKITFLGITLTGAEWARKLGFKDKHSVLDRIDNGWSVERALTTPPRAWNKLTEEHSG